jgi:tRNA(Ile)-lysidine synthase TilS/MesJ
MSKLGGGVHGKGMAGERIDSSQKVSLAYGTAFLITAHTEMQETGNGLETLSRGDNLGILRMRMDHLQENNLATSRTPLRDFWGLWYAENSGLFPDTGLGNVRQVKSATRLSF